MMIGFEATSLGFLIAGIGCCCFSSVLIARYMLQLASFSLHRQMNKSSQSYLSAGLIGIVTGFYTQTSCLQSHLASSQASAQRKELPYTLTMINWNAIGMCLLIFIFLIPIDSVIPYLVGIAGVLAIILRDTRFHSAVHFLFGFLFLYFGIILIKNNADFLVENETSRGLIIAIKHSYFLALLTGALFTGLTQAFVAAALLATVFAREGVFDLYFATMFILGAEIGLGIIQWIISKPISNYTKRSLAALSISHFTAGFFGVLMIYLEDLTSIPLFGALVQTISPYPFVQVPLMILFINVSAAVFLFLIRHLERDKLMKLFPSHGPKEFSSPRYITPLSLDDPEGSINLLGKESAHILSGYSHYFSFMKGNLTKGAIKKRGLTIHYHYRRLFKQLESYLVNLAGRNLDESTSNNLILYTELINYLKALENNLFSKLQFINKVIESQSKHENFVRLSDLLIEGEGAIYLALNDFINGENGEHYKMLLHITRERKDVIKTIKEKYIFQEGIQASPPMRSNFLFLTTLIDRDIWIMRQIAMILNSLPRG